MPADSAAALACLAAAAGIAVLWSAWRRPQRSAPLVLAGWGALAASLALWASTTSVERGIAAGLLAACLLALAVLALVAALPGSRRDRSRRRAARNRPAPEQAAGEPGLRSLASGAGTILLLGPAAGTAALLVSAALFTLQHGAGTEATFNLVLAMFVFPLAWATLAVLAARDSRPSRRYGFIALPAFAATLLLVTA